VSALSSVRFSSSPARARKRTRSSARRSVVVSSTTPPTPRIEPSSARTGNQLERQVRWTPGAAGVSPTTSWATIGSPLPRTRRIGSASWDSSPQNYLEKIFQIPFTLRAMTETGYQNLVERLMVPAGDGVQTVLTTPRMPDAVLRYVLAITLLLVSLRLLSA